MSWRTFFYMSDTASELERKLAPSLVEHDGGITSTASTDVERRIIHLDVSQSELKCALSYAYELKNLENASKYEAINNLAKRRKINRSEYVRSVIQLEAEAVLFRCIVFRQLGANDSEFPGRMEYLIIYDRLGHSMSALAISQIALYIQENGIVRRRFSAKKYYADCYESYAGLKQFPEQYDQLQSKTIIYAPWNR